jgi:hypothetical protein
MWLDKTTDQRYVCTDASAGEAEWHELKPDGPVGLWDPPDNFSGETGDTGDTGVDLMTGATGATGYIWKGPTGLTGPNGPCGDMHELSMWGPDDELNEEEVDPAEDGHAEPD